MYTLLRNTQLRYCKKSPHLAGKTKDPYEFHDYKKSGITTAKLKQWSSQVGWEILLNKKGTTWRNLDEKTQASVTNEKAAIKILSENTSAIKRPVIEKGDKVMMVGFDEAAYEKLMESDF